MLQLNQVLKSWVASTMEIYRRSPTWLTPRKLVMGPNIMTSMPPSLPTRNMDQEVDRHRPALPHDRLYAEGLRVQGAEVAFLAS